MLRNLFFIGVCLLLTVQSATSAVDSQWRGPNRDGIYPEKNLLKKWPAEGPQKLWDYTGLGEGFTSVAVAGDKIYTTGMNKKGDGVLFALTLAGKLLWKVVYASEFSTSYPGVRSTPTVAGNQIYLLSGTGWLVCLNSATGEKIWSLNILDKFGGKNLYWGVAESPLVDGNRVFITPGGPDAGVVALNRMNGKTIWASKGHSEKAAYCSPRLVVHNHRKLLVTMTEKSILGLDMQTGKVLWTHPHETKYDINPNTPIYRNGELYCVSGYGTGGVKLRLSPDGTNVTEVWRDSRLDSQIGAAVLVNGYIFGSGHKNRKWFCLDWKTGQVRYKSAKRGKGNIISADNMLYCYDESGKVLLVKPDPTAFKIVSSFKVPLGKNQHWAHLVIKNGRLYVRHGNALMVYRVK